MKKILLVMPYFYPHKGGSQRYAEELYAHLIEQYPNHFSVDVLCYNTNNVLKKEVYRGMKIYRVDCWQLIPGRFALPKPWNLIKNLNMLSKEQYDFVNSHLVFFDPTWWVWLYAKIIGAKSIFTEHIATHPVHQNKIVQLLAKLVNKTIGRFSLDFYDTITATNKAAKYFLRDELGVKKNISLIYGGTNINFFSPLKIKRDLPAVNKKLKANDILIVYVGRLIWTKGLTYLYQAIKELIPWLQLNVYFVMAGGGELEEELKQQIKKDKLSRRIFLTGPLSYEEVRNLLRMSDIFINPSHHNEGFPNTILEAGACKNFVIATDNAGTKEIIKNKQTGLLIPQKDQKALEKSLYWAIKHPKERKEIAENLHFLIKSDFDWSILSRKFANFLQ